MPRSQRHKVTKLEARDLVPFLATILRLSLEAAVAPYRQQGSSGLSLGGSYFPCLQVWRVYVHTSSAPNPAYFYKQKKYSLIVNWRQQHKHRRGPGLVAHSGPRSIT